MRISVASILQAPHASTHYAYQETIPLIGDAETLVDPVVGEFDVIRASGRILQVKGEFKSRLRLTCDRCGEPYEAPVVFNLEEALEITEDPISSKEVDDKVSADGTLDVTDLVRQGLLLELPPRRLCGCEPVTGQAADQKTDPRWAALMPLQQDANGKH